MKVLEGPTSDSAMLVPADEHAKIVLYGIGPDEAAACFGLGNLPRPWNIDRSLEVALPDDPAPDGQARPAIDDVSYSGEFEDGAVNLRSGGFATVRVTSAHQGPDLPMPQSLMLAIGHQWARLGRMSLHAASFRLEGTSIVLLGDSEAGKSTMTLAALTMGAELLSDDWLLVREHEGEPVCTSLRHQMLLRSGDPTRALLERLPEDPSLHSAHDSKVWLRRHPSGQLPESLPCDVIIHLNTPDSRPSTTCLTPLPSVQAYTRLLGGTSALLLSSRLGEEAQRLHTLAQSLVRKPAFCTTTGLDLIERSETTWRSILDRITLSPDDRGKVQTR